MKKYKTRAVVQHGVVMKDFVAVPLGLLARTAELKKYLPISRAFAEHYRTGSMALLDAYSETALRRVWASVRISWYLTCRTGTSGLPAHRLAKARWRAQGYELP